MTSQDFITSIIKLYEHSRLLTVQKGNHNIWRGVSHSISSQSEDLFALMVAEELGNPSLEFIVDKTFTLKKSDDTSVQFRPDLAIIQEGQLVNIVDLKMDMGYKRRYHETPEFKKEELKFKCLRSGAYKDISYKKDGNTIKVEAINNITNQIVVVSEKNEGKSSNRTDMVKTISTLDWVDIFYLSGGVHPNTYDKNALNKLTINNKEFSRLFDLIKANVK